MTPLELFLSRAQRSKRTRDGRYRFSCQGPLHQHGDRHQSGQVDEKPDGTLLVICRVGCRIDQIIAPMGLELHDLYPPRELVLRRESEGRRRDRLDPCIALQLIQYDVNMAALLVLVASKHELTPERRRRLFEAANSIRKTLKAVGLREAA